MGAANREESGTLLRALFQGRGFADEASSIIRVRRSEVVGEIFGGKVAGGAPRGGSLRARVFISRDTYGAEKSFSSARGRRREREKKKRRKGKGKGKGKEERDEAAKEKGGELGVERR